MKKLNGAVGLYALVGLISVLGLIWALRLWQADLGVPFRYARDSMFNLMSIKTLVDSGWFLRNNYLGAPFSLEAYDFPFDESLSLIILKIIATCSNPFIAHNLFYILTFPLTAITSLFVLKRIGISNRIAIVVSLLYVFIPYHFFRLEHLFLSTYYMVPLITLVTTSLYSDTPPLAWNANAFKQKFNLKLIDKRSIASILICIVVGSTGMYYAFFSCLFIAAVSIYAFLDKKDKKIIGSGLVLIAIITATLLINLSPSILYWIVNGTNHAVADRSPFEVEIYGLKIIHLLLPVYRSYFSPFGRITEKYDHLLPLSELQIESRYAALGIIGSIGFLSLITGLFVQQKSVRTEPSFSHYYRILVVLNVTAVLYATVGGFSSVFALIVSPQIRGLNRISIFIAFFSLAAIALLLEAIEKRFFSNRIKQVVFNSALTLILMLGILNQTSPIFIPNYSELKKAYLNDRTFAHALESSVAKGSSIFQLPYVPYPESVAVNKMIDYDHFRPYLHSNDLRWSYGVMRGRHDWQVALLQDPIDINTFLAKIAIVGFSGIYIDRNGYSDSGKRIESELQARLGVQPIVSQDQRFSFYNISEFRNRLLNRLSPVQVSQYRHAILYPIDVVWNSGFYGADTLRDAATGSTEVWHWANKEATLVLKNPAKAARKFQIKMLVATGWPEPSKLHIESTGSSKVLAVNSNPVPFTQTIDLPAAAEMKLIFRSEAKRVDAPSDPRELYFHIQSFEVVELDQNALNFQASSSIAHPVSSPHAK